MAIMIPGEPGPTGSAAERRLFTRLRRELPDECFVLHSLGLANHPTKLWGEGDFVVLSRLGVFVIEVKGGGVSCDKGEWIFRRHDGTESRKREGPFAQAQGAMSAVRDRIHETPHLRGFLYGYGVIMPDETFVQTGPEIELRILWDKRQYHEPLDNFIRQLARYASEELAERKDGKTYRQPQKPDLEEMRQLLRPDFRTALTLNSSLCQLETEQVRLTEEQMHVLRRMEANPRTLIRGAAGTGKTILALDVAAREARRGRALYLCFNRLLGQHVGEHVKLRCAGLPLEAESIHMWFRRLIEDAQLVERLERIPSTDPQFYSSHFPSVAADAILELEREPYSCIVIDEGQDLLRSGYLDVLDLVLEGGLNNGKWSVFYDPSQEIYSGLDPAEVSRLLGFGCAQYRLTVNCRNTQGIAVQTSIVSGIDSAIEGAIEGGLAENEFVASTQHAVSRLEHWVRRLRAEGLGRNDMIILGTRTLANSSLGATSRVDGLRIRDISRSDEKVRDSLDYCTMHAFKGLERKAVLAWDVDSIDMDEHRLLHYCGLSRARSCLVTFVAESQRESYTRFAQEFGQRQAERLRPDSIPDVPN